MRHVLLGISVCLLAGCSTYSGIQSKPPAHAANSALAPQPIAECVAKKWMDFNSTTHITTDGDTRVVVMPTGGIGAEAVMTTLTATPAGTGSRVEMRTTLGNMNSLWEKAQTCI